MPETDKWAKYKDTPDKWAKYKDAPITTRARSGATLSDFTSNPKGEGLYRMSPTQGYTDTAQEIRVPFSKVSGAQAAGFNLHPDEKARYRKDYTYRGRGPTLGERMQANVLANTEPLPDTSVDEGGYWHQVAAPWLNVGKMPLNVISRTYRGVMGLPEQTIQTVKDIHAGRPEGINAIDPLTMAQGEVEGYQRDVETLGPMAALSNVGGDVATVYLAGKAVEPAASAVRQTAQVPSRLWRKATGPFRPHITEVAGVKIPMAASEAEAEPLSWQARSQRSLKRSGAGAKHFERLEGVQQAGAKQAIANIAEGAADAVGSKKAISSQRPTLERPDYRGFTDKPEKAMEFAAKAIRNRASALYDTLDTSLRTVSGGPDKASDVLRGAVKRARRFGVDYPDIPKKTNVGAIQPDAQGFIDWRGRRISKAEHPGDWAKLVADGIIDDSGHGTPIKAFQKVRSHLLDIQRSTQDAALRHNIGDAVRDINNEIETALSNTPQLLADWKEADRLWSKGKAIDEVTDAIRSVTKGTPMEQQAPGAAQRPRTLRGARLVARLNDLDHEGILKKAFNDKEIDNLRAVANILDRAQETPIGRKPTEPLTLLHGSFVLVQKAIGTMGLVRLMTTPDGVTAFRALEAAKTPTARQIAMRNLAKVVAAYSAAQQPKTLRELQAEAEKNRPAGAQAAVSYAPQ